MAKLLQGRNLLALLAGTLIWTAAFTTINAHFLNQMEARFDHESGLYGRLAGLYLQGPLGQNLVNELYNIKQHPAWRVTLETPESYAFTTAEQDEMAKGRPVQRRRLGLFTRSLTFCQDLGRDNLYLVIQCDLGAGSMGNFLLGLVLVLLATATVFHLTTRTFFERLDRINGLLLELAHTHLPYDKASQYPLPAAATTNLKEALDLLEQLRTAWDLNVKEQKTLTHALSHEIRTPLARMRLALDMYAGSRNFDEAQELVLQIEEDVEEMFALVSDLMQWARLAHRDKRITMKFIDLAKEVRAVVADVAGLRATPTIEVNAPDQLICALNARMVRQALTNILRNAQRYANKQVVVTLRQESETAWLTVDDDGPGIPSKDRERVWIPFEQLDTSRTKKTGGIGLGMAIVYHAIRGNEGQVSIEDSPGGGTRIVIQFPIRVATTT